MQTWMEGFHHLLSMAEIPELDSGDDEQPSPLGLIKAQVGYFSWEGGWGGAPDLLAWQDRARPCAADTKAETQTPVDTR